VIRVTVFFLALLISKPALGSDVPITRPEAPKASAGQCGKNIALTKGKSVPLILASTGPRPALTCSAVAVPLSDYADLLATEQWANAVAARYKLDTTLLETELDWYKKQLEEESKPPPFLERPGTQRWFGRLETLVTVGVVAAGLGAAYQYGSGGFR